jgi:ACS family hexuronate transporter-like MFS transporter
MADFGPSAQSPELPSTGARHAALRAWVICGLLLLATMLMYMDRQALAQQKTEILHALKLSDRDYGRLETGFGLAFAVGGIVTGIIADRISPRWLYPMVLLGWSSVGFATGWATSYRELLVCRVLLGFFEAGHWPCALVTSQRLLSRSDRPLGNSILQSGASLGAIATPIVVLLLTSDAIESWRLPFRVIGAAGVFWIVAWLSIIRSTDLELTDDRFPAAGTPTKPCRAGVSSALRGQAGETPAPQPQLPDRQTASHAGSDNAVPSSSSTLLVRRFIALAVVVITINLCWQYFRAWMPGMLREQYGYSKKLVQVFSIGYYLTADLGCLSVGFLVKWLASRGVSVHGARMSAFLGCSLLTGLAIVAAFLPATWLLLAALLCIGFGSLGQFPIYYAFSQDLSARRMGRVTGALSFLTWTATGLVNVPIGNWIDKTHSYSEVTFLAGVMPFLGFLALLVLWNGTRERRAAAGR